MAAKVMFGALDDVFANTKVKPKDIKIALVNCSLFDPTPSLTAMIVNGYKMGGDVRTFNLGGMGCRAIDLAKDMLQLHGNSRAMLIPNCHDKHHDS